MMAVPRFLPGLTFLAWVSALGAGLATPVSSARAESDDSLSKHGVKCSGCEAKAVWRKFVEHLRASGREAALPEEYRALPAEDATVKEETLPSQDAEPTKEVFPPDLESGDPIKGVLFRISSDLVNLDAIFQEAPGAQLAGETLEKARSLSAKLAASDDIYLQAYGRFYTGKLDVEGNKFPAAIEALSVLVDCCHFLPRHEARRALVKAYLGVGDDTLALLEIQFFLLDIPEQNDADRSWATEELARIRERKHPGPLHHCEASMLSLSGELTKLEVGVKAQLSEQRVEDILDKVARLLEKKGGT